ncbi:MAG TPA: xanthine dehydrogenase family protein subunit M [Candidatus Limnocylindrales bacterium]|nr:xanthine dehydrogenase family protein subunit M [Candidatus Limnocylindrales bacterium]
MPVEPPIVSPRSLADAYAVLAEAPHRPIAGGTDVMVQLTGELGPVPDRMIDLWRLQELRGIALEGDALVLGALTTFTDIRRSPICLEVIPALVDAAATIGAAQIQNRATIGGNAMNASPAGDSLPVLLAADAEFVAGSARGERRIPASAFWVAYRTTAVEPDELLLRVRIPLAEHREIRFRKVGTRRAQAISKVVIALARREPEPGGSWSEVRLALGSVADRPIRAAATEAVLEGAEPTQATADRAADTLAGELQPIDDVRSTADYRRMVAARVLHRLVREAGGW